MSGTTNKDTGDVGELTFILRAKKIGLNVLMPYSSVTPYDVVVDNGKTLLKVQVKTTNSKIKKQPNKYKVNIGRGSTGKKIYSNEHCDFFAIYLLDHDIFYIIPQSEINTLTLNLYPENSESSMYKYLNAWHFLK